ncbi:MAG TPA: hypothetical protein VHO25_09940 [Polyangiaceae bacterium]|nr:hypothetical protein [Polyangiaceae bacterium]
MAALVSALRRPKIAELAQRLEFLLAGLTLLLGSLLTWAVSGFRMAQAALVAVVQSMLAPGTPQPAPPLVAHDTSVWPVVVYVVAVLQLIAGLYLCRARSNLATAIIVVAGFFVCLIDLLYFGDPLSKQLDAYSMACAFLVLPTALKPTRA